MPAALLPLRSCWKRARSSKLSTEQTTNCIGISTSRRRHQRRNAAFTQKGTMVSEAESDVNVTNHWRACKIRDCSRRDLENMYMYHICKYYKAH